MPDKCVVPGCTTFYDSNSEKVSGHAVAESLTAQYSTLQPLSIRRVQSQRSSPWSYWMQWMGKVERVLIGLSPKQRALLGVPKPGHEYWNEENVRMDDMAIWGL